MNLVFDELECEINVKLSNTDSITIIFASFYHG